MPDVGIPYAEADVDGDGYYVVCPACGRYFYGIAGEGTGTGFCEDEATKDPALLYATHYEAEHAAIGRP